MTLGVFDDRNDARIGVKWWLGRTDPQQYTLPNICSLSHEMMEADMDPVDDIGVARRETSFGILLGIVEFAEEQLAHVSGQITGSVDVQMAQAAVRNAVEMLRRQPRAACVALCAAMKHLESAGIARFHQGAKAMGAVRLAAAMLTGGRSVQAPA